jgi:non-ribosomal peptide synthetase component F
VVGASESFTFSRELSDALRALGRKEGGTLFMVLLAGLGVLLHHDSAAEDVVVGTNFAGRHRGEFESVIGAFVNTLALRVSLSGDPTFKELLRRARETVLGADAHQDVPFEMVLEALRPARPADDAPLFPIMLVLQDVAGSEPLELSGLLFHPVELERRSANFDLTLFVYTERERLAGSLEYNAGLYDRTDMTRLLDHFAVLLQQAVDDPGSRLSELTPVRQAVLEGFSDVLEEA